VQAPEAFATFPKMVAQDRYRERRAVLAVRKPLVANIIYSPVARCECVSRQVLAQRVAVAV